MVQLNFGLFIHQLFDVTRCVSEGCFLLMIDPVHVNQSYDNIIRFGITLIFMAINRLLLYGQKHATTRSNYFVEFDWIVVVVVMYARTFRGLFTNQFLVSIARERERVELVRTISLPHVI